MKKPHFKLTGITIYMTQKCNFKCSYCFEAGRLAKAAEPEVGMRALDFLFENADFEQEYLTCTFFGGEPLLEYKQMRRLVEYGNELAEAHSIPLLFNVVTNGSLLDDKVIAYLVDNNFAILLSWDGESETQSRGRPSGKHDMARILHNVSCKLSKSAINFAVRMTITRSSVFNFYNDLCYVLSSGVRDVGFVPAYELNWTDPELEILASQLNSATKLFLRAYDSGQVLRFQPLLDFAAALSNKGKINHYYMHPCHVHDFAIDVDGYIYPCHRFVSFTDDRGYKLGSVFAKSVDESAFAAFLEKRSNLFSRYPETAGCPAPNYHLNNDITQPYSGFERFDRVYKTALKPLIRRKDCQQILSSIQLGVSHERQ